jgi:hypothetical protein
MTCMSIEMIWIKLFGGSRLTITYIELYHINFIKTFTLRSRMTKSFTFHPKGNRGRTLLRWLYTWGMEPGFDPHEEPHSDLSSRGGKTRDRTASSQSNLTSKVQDKRCSPHQTNHSHLHSRAPTLPNANQPL